eukprot:CAMPEP_0178412806 /NCGR_PEP_ID=MMETSP0689_2-20121128/22205_1 /TAXON_ID=160604 /ORGANISM="Amphidinium massartii, Strain CS-259" /LENGTH=432 /DNA_ID=CAMNT_0020034065 /DNA_START=36 /DNA_END=1330 /DNA_ORIENTATION=+
MPLTEYKDHYEILGCSPDTPLSDLKRAYHEKLREYHPDKRPDTPGGTGQRITQALNEAWEILSDPLKKEAYDSQWRREKVQRLPPEERADYFRRQGNEAYKTAQEACRQKEPENLLSATAALQKYQAAISLYSQGVELAPRDHRLWSNRALCWGAVRSWGRCREDAMQVTALKPTFMKGWFLWAKSLWKEGHPDQAQEIIDRGLQQLPGHQELLALAAEIQPDLEAMRQSESPSVRLPNIGATRGGHSRNVSPCYTPAAASRVVTPTRSQSQGPSRCPPVPPGRGHSRSPAPSRFEDAYEATFDAQIGKTAGRHGRSAAREGSRERAGGLDATARFGAGRSESPNPNVAARGRSRDPGRADAAEGTYGYYHEATFGSPHSYHSQPQAPPRDKSPPIPPGWPSGTPAPQRHGSMESQDASRHKVSLAGMAAKG